MEALQLERTAAILRGRNRILRELVGGAPLQKVFELMTEAAEQVVPGMKCSILLLDRASGTLRHGAAPGLPKAYCDMIEGLTIGPEVGSCGAAAFTGERVLAEDVLVHPNWVTFREAVDVLGMRSCWSEPIRSLQGDVLGTFAMYHREPRLPDAFEVELISTNAQVAAYAIEHHTQREERRKLEAQLRQIIDLDPHMIFAKDSDGRFLLMNRANAEAYGTTVEELTGRLHGDVHPVPEEAARMLADDAQVIEQGTPKFIAEESFVDHEGVERILQTTKIPFTSAGTNVRAVLGVAVDITDRKRIEEQLRDALEELEERRRAQLESMTGELLLAEERERRRLAIDLHDGLNQIITLAQMKLASLRSRLDGKAKDDLRSVEVLVDQANQSARSLTFQLSPPILHDLGFEAALQWLVEEVEESYGLSIELEEAGPEVELDERLRSLLFRAVRELLINVAKHAEANSVVVALSRSEHELRLRVEDDGTAFEIAEVDASRGLGLSSIRERLSNLGGEMHIESAPGRGTKISLTAPLAKTDET